MTIPREEALELLDELRARTPNVYIAYLHGLAHDGDCLCRECLIYWIMTGTDSTGGYGPFEDDLLRKEYELVVLENELETLKKFAIEQGIDVSDVFEPQSDS